VAPRSKPDSPVRPACPCLSRLKGAALLLWVGFLAKYSDNKNQRSVSPGPLMGILMSCPWYVSTKEHGAGCTIQEWPEHGQSAPRRPHQTLWRETQ
jgi:hypothetical protein